jgi:DNA-binding NarL/FixJ family response regulator
MIKIVVIDEKESDRNKITKLLSSQVDFEIVGLGTDGYDALKLVSALKPDITILDFNLSYIDGAEILPLLKRKSPSTSIIILTSVDDDEHICKALENKVPGYLLKNTDMDMLVNSIRCIYRGGHYITPKIAAKAFHILSELMREKNKQKDITPSKGDSASFPLSISRTELRIMAFIGQGQSNKEIAENLCLKIGTVRNYISSAMQKAGLRHRTQVAIYALRNGITRWIDEESKTQTFERPGSSPG